MRQRMQPPSSTIHVPTNLVRHVSSNLSRLSLTASVVFLLLLAASVSTTSEQGAVPEPGKESYILQATELEVAKGAVEGVGGTVTHELGIIRAVGARLTQQQLLQLKAMGDSLRIYRNQPAVAAGKPNNDNNQGDNDGQADGGPCSADSEVLLGFSDLDLEAKWALVNTGTVPMTVAGVSVNWPESNGNLSKVKLGTPDDYRGKGWTKTLTTGDHLPTSIRIDSGWLGTPEDRQIDPGQTMDLKFTFLSGLDTRQSSYEFSVDFAEGCSAEYIPGSRGMPVVPEGYIPDTFVPRRIQAPDAWAEGVTGYGVTVAVVDTAVKHTLPGIKADTQDMDRVYTYYDAIHDVLCDGTQPEGTCLSDAHGHGTHVAGVLLNSQVTDYGQNGGVAPDAGLVAVRTLGDDGLGTYADVIRGIEWVVNNKDRYGIRVMNLSLSAPPRSHYWVDPLNQAVMAAWQAGIVVVASAGNSGPDPMSVGVPGNVPYVITVGALSDHYSHQEDGDDFLTSFSSAR